MSFPGRGPSENWQHSEFDPVSPYLSDTEIADMCEPLTQPAAQLRYLRSLGLQVFTKPNGRPLLARGEFERVMVGRQPEAAQNPTPGQPNRAALLQLFQGGRNGKKAQGQQPQPA